MEIGDCVLAVCCVLCVGCVPVVLGISQQHGKISIIFTGKHYRLRLSVCFVLWGDRRLSGRPTTGLGLATRVTGYHVSVSEGPAQVRPPGRVWFLPAQPHHTGSELGAVVRSIVLLHAPRSVRGGEQGCCGVVRTRCTRMRVGVGGAVWAGLCGVL